ncbi:MAG: pyrroloquinoline quinone biosynthesis protein PqqE [Gemmatimonas sp.]|nr:pyrroloquinoline quinone biosynthesis protein PqqE [Gemmatimonas sp.]
MQTGSPYSLVAELTYRCPLRCPYCSNPVSCGDEGYRQELSTEEWSRVFREAAELGVLQLGLTGGEPMARRDLPELVAAAAEHGLYSTLVTAAVTLDRPRAERLLDAGLDHVQISLQDSDPANSDRIAGTRSWQRKIEAASLVRELGFPLTINCVLHRQNLDHIGEILSLAESLEADRVELANTQYYGWALENRAALMPTREQLERAEAVVADFRERLGARMEILYVIPDYFDGVPKPCTGGWGRQTIVIAPDGSVMPCHAASSIPGLEFDSVRDHGLEWIWVHSSAFNRFRGTDWMPEPCRSCERKEIDFGGCRCQALLLTGDASATDPACMFSPHHQVVVEARERTQAEGSATLVPLIYRSLKRQAAAK